MASAYRAPDATTSNPAEEDAEHPDGQTQLEAAHEHPFLSPHPQLSSRWSFPPMKQQAPFHRKSQKWDVA